MNEITRKLIVTADDLGLSSEINQGILDAHQAGIVTSASLLVNAPETESAVALARKNPGLEIGLHWSLVEGHCLLGRECSLTDTRRYLGKYLCLHRHWKPFMIRYFLGRIRMEELAEELELQVKRFLSFFPDIPFANGTQHLHLLPGVRNLIIDLAKKYGIRALRVPHKIIPTPGVKARVLFSRMMGRLGHDFFSHLEGSGIRTAGSFAGFDMSGTVQADRILSLLDHLPKGSCELMTHPGLDCPALRKELPWGYHEFNWAGEREALISSDIRKKIDSLGISLIRFNDL